MTKNDKPPIIIFHVSQQPFLSIGRHYGGIRVWGYEYIYYPDKDAYIRKDYEKIFNKMKKNWDEFTKHVKTITQ
jgi:predicted transcriptional regulator